MKIKTIIFLTIIIILNTINVDAQQSNFIKNTKIIQKFTDQTYENKYDIGNNLINYSDEEHSLFENSYKNVSGYLGNSNVFRVNIYLNEGNSVEIISQMTSNDSYKIGSIYNIQNRTDNLILNNDLYNDYSNNINYSVDSEFKAPKTGVYEISFNLNDSTNVSSLAFKVYKNEYSDISLKNPYQRVWSKSVPTFNSAYYLRQATAMDMSQINIAYNYSVQDYQGGSLYFDTGKIEGLKNAPAGFTIDSNQYGISKGSSKDNCDIPLTSAKQSWIEEDENVKINTCSISTSKKIIGSNNFNNITPAPNIEYGRVSDDLPEFFDFNNDGIINQKSEYIRPLMDEKNRTINNFKVIDVYENESVIRNKFEISFNIGQLSNIYRFDIDYESDGKIDEYIDVSSNELNTELNDTLNPYDNDYSYVLLLKKALKPESNLSIKINSGEYSENHLIFSDMNQMNDLDIYNYSQNNDLQYYNDAPLEHLNGVYEPYIYNGLKGIKSNENIRGWDGEFGRGSVIDTWVEGDFDYMSISSKDELITAEGPQFVINKSIDMNQLSSNKLVFKIDVNDLSNKSDNIKISIHDDKLQLLDSSIFNVSNINVLDIGNSENLNEINFQNLTSDKGIEYLYKKGDNIKVLIEIEIIDFEKLLLSEIINTAYIKIDDQIDYEYCIDSLKDIELKNDNDCMSSVKSNVNYEGKVSLTSKVSYNNLFDYETTIKNKSQIAGNVVLTNKFDDSEMKNMEISSIKLSNGKIINKSDLKKGYLLNLKANESIKLSYTIKEPNDKIYDKSDEVLIDTTYIKCEEKLLCENDFERTSHKLTVNHKKQQILNTGKNYIYLIFLLLLILGFKKVIYY